MNLKIKLVFYPVILISVFFTLACSNVKEKAGDFLADAQEHLKTEDYETAITALNWAIRLDSDLTPALNDRGFAYLQIKEYDKAISDLSKSIRQYHDNADSYYYRACAYAGKRDISFALSDLTQAIELKPAEAPLYFNKGINICKNEAAFYRGVRYLDTNDLIWEIAVYEAALAIDPENHLIKQNLEIALDKRKAGDIMSGFWESRNINDAKALFPENLQDGIQAMISTYEVMGQNGEVLDVLNMFLTCNYIKTYIISAGKGSDIKKDTNKPYYQHYTQFRDSLVQMVSMNQLIMGMNSSPTDLWLEGWAHNLKEWL